MMISGWDCAGPMMDAGLMGVSESERISRLDGRATHAILEAPKSPSRIASLRFGGGLGG